MTTSTIYNRTTQINFSSAPYSVGLRKIFAAALVSRQFCQQLLRDPMLALQYGYMGETFTITEIERDLIISTRANSLAELASHVNESLGINKEQKSGFRNEFNFGKVQYPRTTHSAE